MSAQVVSWLAISISLPPLPAAQTALLLTAQPVAAVILAMLLLGDDLSWLQLLGIVLVVAAIARCDGAKDGSRRAVGRRLRARGRSGGLTKHWYSPLRVDVGRRSWRSNLQSRLPLLDITSLYVH